MKEVCNEIHIYSRKLPKMREFKEKIQGVKAYDLLERNADRIKQPEDEIDREALVQASMQNMELPVEVDM